MIGKVMIEMLSYLKKIKYRATNPFYVGEEYRVLMEEERGDKVSEVRIVDAFGKTGMWAEIERW